MCRSVDAEAAKKHHQRCWNKIYFNYHIFGCIFTVETWSIIETWCWDHPLQINEQIYSKIISEIGMAWTEPLLWQLPKSVRKKKAVLIFQRHLNGNNNNNNNKEEVFEVYGMFVWGKTYYSSGIWIPQDNEKSIYTHFSWPVSFPAFPQKAIPPLKRKGKRWRR